MSTDSFYTHAVLGDVIKDRAQTERAAFFKPGEVYVRTETGEGFTVRENDLTPVSSLNQLADRAHNTAREKGWYDGERPIPERLMLVVSELSEALEEFRKGVTPTAIYTNEGSEKPEGFSVEIADAIIRLLDMCHELGIDVDYVIQLKMKYNETRSYRHGGKVC